MLKLVCFFFFRVVKSNGCNLNAGGSSIARNYLSAHRTCRVFVMTLHILWRLSTSFFISLDLSSRLSQEMFKALTISYMWDLPTHNFQSTNPQTNNPSTIEKLNIPTDVVSVASSKFAFLMLQLPMKSHKLMFWFGVSPHFLILCNAQGVLVKLRRDTRLWPNKWL